MKRYKKNGYFFLLMYTLVAMIASVVLVASLVSCSADESAPASGTPIRLGATIQSGVASLTRATDIPQDALFTAGEDVDIYVTANGLGAQSYDAPRVYTVESGTTVAYGTSTTANILSVKSGDSQVYSGSSIDILGVYPAGYSYATTLYLASDQSSTAFADYKQNDVMVAYQPTVVASANPVNLPFRHMTARLVVELEYMNGFVQSDIVSMTVTAKRGLTLSKTGDVYTSSASGDASVVTMAGANTAAGVCLLPPQTIAAGSTMITINLGAGKTGPLYYKPASAIMLEAGHTYLLKIKATNVGITGYLYGIDSWPDPTVVDNGNMTADGYVLTEGTYVKWLLTWLDKYINGTETVAAPADDERNLNWTPNY